MKRGISGLLVALALGVLLFGTTAVQAEDRITPLTSPVALFCTGPDSKTITAWSIDAHGVGQLAWSFTPGVTNVIPSVEAVVAAQDTSPTGPNPAIGPTVLGDGSLINENGVGLWFNEDGRYSALVTQDDGKQYVFYFNGCPDTGPNEAFVIDGGAWIPVRVD